MKIGAMVTDGERVGIVEDVSQYITAVLWDGELVSEDCPRDLLVEARACVMPYCPRVAVAKLQFCRLHGRK